MAAFRDRIAGLCAPLPGASRDDPRGGRHDAWKVGAKMFACMGAISPGVAVKCADIETASMLIETGMAARAPCFHRSWLPLPEDCPEDELAHCIRTSDAIVRAGLPLTLRRALTHEAPDVPPSD